MTIIEKIIVAKLHDYLEELEIISGEIINEIDRKNKSTSVYDLTNVGEIPKNMLSRLGRIQLKITLLKIIV